MKEKGDLNEKQQAFVQRKNSTLARINNPFPRPSQPLYQGQPHILVGGALGLEKPATAAVVDGTTGEAIAYRSIKQLLAGLKRKSTINKGIIQAWQISHIKA